MQPQDHNAAIALLLDSEPWTRLGYHKADWDRYFSSAALQERESFVSEQDGRVTGIAVVRKKFLLGDYLELLGVAKDARRAGTGKALLAHVESLVFGRGKNLFACVSDFNESARAFYKQQGYREIGPIQDLLIQGSSEILVRKTAGPARPA
ncbi:MAG: GNAT family N-acetyltransferase [Nitrospira sp. CR1.3]|nr:GNAT family N-acetyltransferase [Nitrospira sp. CR1.3]